MGLILTRLVCYCSLARRAVRGVCLSSITITNKMFLRQKLYSKPMCMFLRQNCVYVFPERFLQTFLHMYRSLAQNVLFITAFSLCDKVERCCQRVYKMTHFLLGSSCLSPALISPFSLRDSISANSLRSVSLEPAQKSGRSSLVLLPWWFSLSHISS